MYVLWCHDEDAMVETDIGDIWDARDEQDNHEKVCGDNAQILKEVE